MALRDDAKLLILTSLAGGMHEIQRVRGLIPEPQFATFALELRYEKLRNTLEDFVIWKSGERCDHSSQRIENILAL